MKELINAFRYAFAGMKAAFRTQQNIRIEVIVSIAVIIAAAAFNISATEWMIITICLCAVLSLELINTALEKLCDIFSKETDMRIKFIKDISAASVLIACFGAFVCGIIIFLPKAIHLFQSN